MQAKCRSSVSDASVKTAQRGRRMPVWTGIALLLAAAMISAAPAPARAQLVAAVVNGTPITNFDIEQRTRLEQLSTHKTPSRKQVLDELINDKLKLAEAKKYSVEATESEVESAFNTMASRMGLKPEQLTQALASHRILAATLKSRIRADLSWNQLVRGRYQASLQIGDRDIQSIIRSQDNADGSVGYIYTLRPILLIVPKGSSPAAYEARLREADSLRSRFDGCQRGLAFVRGLRDVAIRDPIFRNSADVPETFRKMLNSLEVGRLTTPERTNQGVEVFALCDKKATRAETPQKQEARQQIFAKRYEAQSKRYINQLRRSAMIEFK